MFNPKSRILVVDDMMAMRKLVGKALLELGFTDVTVAADGALGWEAFASASPKIDLVISDWNMPVSTGIDLLKRIRADGRFKTTPFILLTAESEKSQVVMALATGVSGYVVKPFNVDSLRQIIEKVGAETSAA